MPMMTRIGPAMRLPLLALMMLVTIGIAGCGEPAHDPTVSRTDAQADQLRERLRTGQGAS